MESSRTRLLDDDDIDHDDDDIKANNNRRKVTLDPGLLDDLLNFSDEDEELSSKQGSLDSIISQESRSNDIGVPSNDQSPKKRGHQRRHSLTVCETPKRTVVVQQQQQPPRKRPPMFETQISSISTASSSSSSSSGSVTPTSDHTP